MPELTYQITTLGCRVNHAEAREIESVLQHRGLRRTQAGSPDLVVVHTCTVTNAAAAKSRQAIRKAARTAGMPPHVIVTGCYATSDRLQAARLAGGQMQVVRQGEQSGRSMIERLGVTVDQWLALRRTARPIREPNRSCSGESRRPLPVVKTTRPAGTHVRAELKIQDGCNASCTFCIIPALRGSVRSKRLDDVVREARQLVDLGHVEIVLTGIFIGAYGHETALRRRQARPEAEHLADLVDAVAGVPGLQRLRISSLEPGDVTETLLDAMLAHAPTVVPHLHLPLQSGSDAVLRRMNRQYRIGDYREMIAMVQERLTVDDLPPAITTDVICGFPGERRDDFEATRRVVEEVGYLHLHVFPFSPRRGTAAARWTDRFVPIDEIRRRVRTLIDLEEDPDSGLSIRFRRRLLGRRVRVVVEQPDRRRTGWMTGRCDHYALIALRTDRPRGALVEAKVTAVLGNRTIATILSPSTSRTPLPVLQ